MSQISNTKRIAKNTLMLYFRQILILLVSLYTVRVVLNTLGAEDYGIYNIVAGVVVLFSFVNNAMASATQRFLNYSLGKNDEKQVNKVFSSSFLIHFVISIVFVILAETVGLWFVNTKLSIPIERHNAMLRIYQFTILTTVFNIVKVPYNALIIAYEKMSFFAWISIIEAILKLGTVFLLTLAKFDKLIFYAFLLTVISIIIFFCYKGYCNKIFYTSHFKFCKDKSLIKELFSFSGWSLLGAGANVCNQQGTNVVLNMFFGVSVNASMGIANQVNSAVYSFVSNFQTAFKPQIVKSYAEEDYDYFNSLIYRTSKFSFYLLLIFVVPLYVNADFILKVWLKTVPVYSASFMKLILIYSLFESLNGSLYMSIQATGDIKKYQIIVSLIIVANLPISIIALTIVKNPLLVLIIRIVLEIIITFWRVAFLSKKINLNLKKFIFSVISNCFSVGIVSFVCTYFLSSFVTRIEGFLISCFLSVVVNSVLIVFVGLSKSEKDYVKNLFLRKLKVVK